MTYKSRYRTVQGLDDIWMRSDGNALTGLWFEGSRGQANHRTGREVRDMPIFSETRLWLDIYFSGRQPDFTPRYRIEDLTPFRKEVVDAMLAIPFGGTVTYGDIAAAIAKRRGISKMSARAIGGAVGWNPICIIVPCHRVIGANRNLTGYGGGIRNKVGLLALEGHDMSRFTIPTRGTAI